MSGRGLVVGLTLTVTLVGTFCVAQADARPIFRLAGGGWQESPLAPLGWVGAGAVAPLRAAADSCSSTAGASPGSVGTRSPTRFGSGGPPAAPACGDYPGRPVATAAGNRGDLLVAGLWFGRVVRLTRGGRARVVAGPKAGESGEFSRRSAALPCFAAEASSSPTPAVVASFASRLMGGLRRWPGPGARAPAGTARTALHSGMHQERRAASQRGGRWFEPSRAHPARPAPRVRFRPDRLRDDLRQSAGSAAGSVAGARCLPERCRTALLGDPN